MTQLHAAPLRTVLFCLTAAVSGPAAADVSELPQEIRDALYTPAFPDPMQPIGDSACRGFIAGNPPPWTVGHASSCAGNTWRAAVMDRLRNGLIPKWQAPGLIREVIVTRSNLDDSVQIRHCCRKAA